MFHHVDERLPTWSEMGWAVADTAIVVGGIGAVARTMQVARVPAAMRGTTKAAYLRAAGQGAMRSLAMVGKAAGMAAAVAIPYVVITRPHLVAGAGGWLAEQVGLPSWVGAFAAYAVLCLALAALAKIALGPLLWTLGRLAGWSAALGGKRAVLPQVMRA